MSIERRLSDALHREAADREVNLPALYAGTRARLDRTQPQPPSGRRWAPALVAASVVGLLVGTTLVAAELESRQLDRPASVSGTSIEGGVADAFDCPHLVTHDWTRPETVTDDYYVASLEGGPAAQAEYHRAARYEYEEVGERAFLRFGNADGSLGLVSEFRRVEDEWTRWRTEACSGPGGSIEAPLEDPLRLGRHGGAPYPAGTPMGATTATLLDDRPYYDGTGLIRHRSLYTEPCGRGVCIVAIHSETSSVSTRVRPDAEPREVTPLFWPPDEMVSKASPYLLYLLYDPAGEVTRMRVRDAGVPVSTVVRNAGWTGDLHAMLVPAESTAPVEVVRRDGEVRGYSPGDIADR